MKKLRLIPVLFLLITLSGCSFSGFANIEDSLVPPALSKYQMEIVSELEKSAGKNLKLKYPNSGEERNAIIMRDLNCDGNRESIVFYQSTEMNASPNVQVKVLSQDEDNNWKIVSGFEGEGIEIDKVSFGEAEDKSKCYFAIGYNLASKSQKKLAVYTFKNSTVVRNKTFDYSAYEVFDIDGDNVDEIIYISNGGNSGNENIPFANLVRLKDGFFVSESSVRTSSEVYEYVKLAKGRVKISTKKESKFVPALYMDGKNINNSLITEIIAYKNGELENLIYSGKEDLSTQTLRDGINFADINGDGVYDIPQSYAIGKYEHSQQNITDWYDYSEGKFIKIMSSYVNGTDGYIFSLPESWTYKVGVTKDQSSGEIVFSLYNSSNGKNEKTVEILKLLTVKRSETQKVKNGYQFIITNGQLQYYAYIPTQIPSEYALSLNDVKKNLITTR